MPNLTIEKTYEDGVTPTSADFDNICDSLETFLNVTKLGADNIADNSITASSTFVAESISADKIQNLAVTTAKIVDGAATAAKFATGAVTTAKILDANVTTSKIAAGAVTSAKLADGAVTAAWKPANGRATNGSLATSTGSATYSSAASPSVMRPCLFIGGGESIGLLSTTSGVVMEGSIILQRAGTIVSNQEFKAGPFNYSASYATSIDIPSSALFYIDTTIAAADASVSFRQGVDLTAGSSMYTSGGNNVMEII